jgi:hypothetical protein
VREAGAHEIAVADIIGAGNPVEVNPLLTPI